MLWMLIMNMTPSRPYVMRAFYEWIVDNDCTPYVVVDASNPNAQVPVEYVQDDQIVLNVSPTAVQDLLMTNEGLEFSARFGGRPMQVYAPANAVLAIYAKENGQGMVFGPGDDEPEPPSDDTPPEKPDDGKSSSEKGRPSLTVVK